MNLKGNLVDFSTAKVMGILNITPDSFYDGGSYTKDTAILQQVEKMLKEGADLIDIGAFSSKPGAGLISEEEEEKRLLESLKSIVKHFPETYLSVDTLRAGIAQKAVDAGAAMINDISAGKYDDKMFETIAKLQVPYVLMHMKGDPENMQQNPEYEDVFRSVFHFFTEKLEDLNVLGVNDIILDPGFGFGKNTAHNYELLKNSHLFHSLECPLLIGLSRKGMIQKVLDVEAKDALNGTTAAHAIALLNGANILRVHDVKAAKEAIQIVDYYQKQ